MNAKRIGIVLVAVLAASSLLSWAVANPSVSNGFAATIESLASLLAVVDQLLYRHSSIKQQAKVLNAALKPGSDIVQFESTWSGGYKFTRREGGGKEGAASAK